MKKILTVCTVLIMALAVFTSCTQGNDAASSQENTSVNSVDSEDNIKTIFADSSLTIEVGDIVKLTPKPIQSEYTVFELVRNDDGAISFNSTNNVVTALKVGTAELKIICPDDLSFFGCTITVVAPVIYTAKFDYNIPHEAQATCNGATYKHTLHDLSNIEKKKGSVINLPACGIKYTLSGVGYTFARWNTKDTGTGTDYAAGSSYTLNRDITFYAQYEKTVENPAPGEDPNTLDICTKTTYSMKIGETVKLKASWSDAHRYEISENEYDAISLDTGDVITAKTIGTAIVKIISRDNPSKWRQCIITVTSDTFSGSALDYKLVGTWKNGQDRLELHVDKTGHITVYRGKDIIHNNASFNWTTWTQGSGNKKDKYFNISNGPSDLNRDFTILSVSSTKLKLKGYLLFGKPDITEWTRE